MFWCQSSPSCKQLHYLWSSEGEWGKNKLGAGPNGSRSIFVAPDASQLGPGFPILVTEIGFHGAIAGGRDF